MTKLILAGLLLTLGLLPAIAPAQTQVEEKVIIGEVQSVDESGTEITLTDGTKLLTPVGSTLRPGVVRQGMQVVAMYQEQANGVKVLTRLVPGR